MSVDTARLANVPLFAPRTPAQRESIAAKFEEREVEPGEHLSHEGGAGYFFFVIDSGAATVTREGGTLTDFGPGDFFGEAAIFKTPRRTATVTATAPTTVFALFGADFAKLVAEIPTLHDEIDHALADRVPL
jgi:CRP-like cAMP-binding protein